MTIDTNTIISVTEANQNFSRVTRIAEKSGQAVIFKNNRPKYMLVDLDKAYGYAVLEDLDKIFPDLLDVFISITASDCKTRHIALLLLQVAGFCDNEDACSNEIPHC